MNRIPFVVVTLIAEWLAVAALILTMFPVDYVPFTDAGQKVTIAFHLIFCKMPSANINATHDQLCQLWKLSETVVLSKRMVQVGKCLKAVSEMNERRPATYDRRECFCLNSYWIPIMIAIAAFVIIETNLEIYKCQLSGPYTRKEFGRHRVVQLIRVVAFGVWFVVFFVSFNDGFKFTKYGDITPSYYYDETPRNWFAALCLFVIAVVGQTCNVLIFDILGIDSVNKMLAEKESKKEPKQPISPPYQPPTHSPPSNRDRKKRDKLWETMIDNENDL